MTLNYEVEKFLSKDTGQEITIIRYYVVVKGIKVYVKPIDFTSKQLLENALIEKDEK